MSEHGVVTDAGDVRFERLLPGPVERVWAYLTEPERRAAWLAGGPMDLWVGGRVELRFRHAGPSSDAEALPGGRRDGPGGVRLVGRVTRCEPPRVLSYTWTEDGAGAAAASEVTFELSPRGDRVLLVLTHRRLGDRAAMRSVAAGWHAHLAVLQDRLAGRAPPLFRSTHAALEEDYERRLPRGACPPRPRAPRDHHGRMA